MQQIQIAALYEEAKQLQAQVQLKERIINHAINEVILMKDLQAIEQQKAAQKAGEK